MLTHLADGRAIAAGCAAQTAAAAAALRARGVIPNPGGAAADR